VAGPRLAAVRQGTLNLSRDPAFAAKVADVIGLYLDPPGGAVVLSSTRRPRSMRWTAPSRCCRSTSGCPRNAPTTTSGTAPRGTFTSVNALIHRIRSYIEHRNTDAKPFVWTATANEILAKVRWVQTSIKQLVDNDAK
jgi:hypothetical protein